MNIERVFLSARNPILMGLYSPTAEVVVVDLDSQNAFTVELPAPGNNITRMFMFFNVPHSGSGNQVTISGKKINYVDNGTVILLPGSGETLIDNGKGTWLTTKVTPLTPFVNYVSFNTDLDTLPTGVGDVYYDPQDKTYSLVTPYATYQIGQELGVVMRNSTGTTVLNGKPVYLSGATGNRPNLTLLDNTSQEDCCKRIGLTTNDIENNADGVVTIGGLVRDVDTSSWSEGDLLYVSSTPGGLTNVRPSYGAMRIVAGVVIRSHPTQGVILNLMRNDRYIFGSLDDGDYSYYMDDGRLRMVGGAQPYEDLQVSISDIRVPAVNAPTERLYNGGIAGGVTFPFLGFALNDYIYFDVQTSHSMPLNTILENHIHYSLPNTTNIGDNFKFQIDAIGAGINSAWQVPSGSPYTAEHSVAANDDTYHRLGDIADLAAINTTVSTVFKCKLTRIAASSSEYGSEVYITFTDCHYRRDGLGSQTESAK